MKTTDAINTVPSSTALKMKAAYILKLQKAFFCFIIFIIQLMVYPKILIAEGTKELMPLDTNHGNIQIYDHKRPFAAFYNTDTLHRLYFHIKNTNEKVYFGFEHIHNSGNNSTTKFRIKDPSGNIVYNATNIPTAAASAGYITSWTAAVAGPKIGGLPSNGYVPFTFSPATTGDFYIEFMTDTTKGTYHIDYFDLTVVDGSGNRLKGRLWSYCWDLSSRSYTNPFYAKMYVLSNDGYVARIDFNGCEPYGFTVSNNSTGVSNTGNPVNDRKSVAGTFENPQFKIFLNNPDTTVYHSGTLLQVISSLNMIDNPVFGSPVRFTITVNKACTAELIIDLNGVQGYQIGTTDVDLVQNISAGTDTITWNGKDGLGNYVLEGVTVQVSSLFSTGVSHFPTYDIETNINGFKVNEIRPDTGSRVIFWDDSKLTNGTTNINDYTNLSGHSWPWFFGDMNTMNSWWNGTGKTGGSFQFNIGSSLPVEFLSVSASAYNDYVKVNWSTASETNNDYFTVERSADGINFEPLADVKGAGNSNTVLAYEYTDDNPVKGISYYRIRQTDYNGAFKYSDIILVNTSVNKNASVGINASNGILHVTINNALAGPLMVKVYNTAAALVYSNAAQIGSGSSTLDLSPSLPTGIYIVHVNMNNMQPVTSKVLMN